MACSKHNAAANINPLATVLCFFNNRALLLKKIIPICYINCIVVIQVLLLSYVENPDSTGFSTYAIVTLYFYQTWRWYNYT